MDIKGKKLYKVKEGKLIAGVAMGVSEYLDIDVNVVRLVMVIINILTSGSLSLVYGIAWIILPEKSTF